MTRPTLSALCITLNAAPSCRGMAQPVRGKRRATGVAHVGPHRLVLDEECRKDRAPAGARLCPSRDATDADELSRATVYELPAVWPSDLNRGACLDDATMVDEAVSLADLNLPSLEMR